MRSVNYRERREVAERLRKASDHGHGISCDAVDKALGIWYDDSYSGCVFARESVLRLADLIDPTCKIVPFDEESMRLPHCSVCGQPMLKPWPNHCPGCGARVVADNGE